LAKAQKKEEKQKAAPNTVPEETKAKVIAFLRQQKNHTCHKTSGMVKAGIGKNRNEVRSIMRQLANESVIKMEKGTNKRYTYTLSPVYTEPQKGGENRAENRVTK